MNACFLFDDSSTLINLIWHQLKACLCAFMDVCLEWKGFADERVRILFFDRTLLGNNRNHPDFRATTVSLLKLTDLISFNNH